MPTSGFIKKLLKKSKPKPSSKSNSSSPQPSVSSTSSTIPIGQRYTFDLISDGTSDETAIPGVDIIAIHGLNGDPYHTWEEPNSKTLWLRDLLPKVIPGARIYTYGYPAGLFWSQSKAGLEEYAQRLLAELLHIIDRKTPRPIIFVCHSLGGIVCKKALVLAHEDDAHYGDILRATTSIAFFGTPHKGGGGIMDIATPVARILNYLPSTSKAVRAELLDTLTPGSMELESVAKSFKIRAEALEIVSFHETRTIKPFSELIVDKTSSTLDIPNELVLSLSADHREICRFGSETDQDYRLVSRQIATLAKNAMEGKPGKSSNRNSSNPSLSDTEKSCMGLLKSTDLADYRNELPRPVQGTFSWILSDFQFQSWIQSEKTGLLWVTGEPGCGKTMLSAFLTEHLKLTRLSQVFFFFCDDKVATQRDANAILRGLLYQILQSNRRLIRHVKRRYELDGSSLATSFSALWEVFIKIVDDRSGPVSVIVDALDECEEKTRRYFLNAIAQLIQRSHTPDGRSRNYVKFFITSRPSLWSTSDIRPAEQSRLSLEQHQTMISEDVRLVIQTRLEDVASRLNFSDELKDYLQQVLCSQAGRTFLWVNLVLQSLERSLMVSKKDVDRILQTFPPGLEDTYSRFLTAIPVANRHNAKTLLGLLMGSSRHLALVEINIAFTIDQNHDTVREVLADCQPSIERTMRGIIGSFIRVNNSKVSLIHQSVKDFLSQVAPNSESEFVREAAINDANAALCLARACIQYLLLDDFRYDLFQAERRSLETASLNTPLRMDSDLSALQKSIELDLEPDGLNLFLEDVTFLDEPGVDEEAICASLAQQYEFFDYAATHWAKHYAACEGLDKDVDEAARRLSDNSNSCLKNWLTYYWRKSDMEHSVPDNFDAVKVGALFNLPGLVRDAIARNGDQDPAQIRLALFWAARMGSSKAVQELTESDIDPNCRGIRGYTPLMIASQYGHQNVVTLLLQNHRTAINLRGDDGRSPLSLAAGNGHKTIVETLLSRNDIQPEEHDFHQWSPLFHATSGDHTDIMKLLLQRNSVDINAVDNKGRSPISHAAGDGLLEAFTLLRRSTNVDINQKDLTGLSPLLWAAKGGHTGIVSQLMRDQRVDRSATDHEQRNVYTFACEMGHADIVKILSKYRCPGADQADISGWTPLAWALSRRSTRVVEAVLASPGVQVDHQDQNGRTALIWAAVYGYLDVVQLLILWGANPNHTPDGGRKAIDLAREQNHTDIVNLLATYE